MGCCEEIDSFLLGEIVGGWIFEVPFKAAVFFLGCFQGLDHKFGAIYIKEGRKLEARMSLQL